MKTLLARPTKGIDQAAQAATYPGGVYIRLDDRSTVTQNLYDAQGSALSMSTVYACVRVLSEDVAKLPLILYRRTGPGGRGRERATDHPLYSVLHDQPNPDMTSFVWRELVMAHLTTWGNHYSEKVYDPFGRLQLWPIRPDRMEVKYGEDGRKVYTYISPSGSRREMEPGSVFHIAGLSSNGLVGLSPIALHMKTLRLAETAQEFGTNFLANNARPATVLSHPATVSPDAAKRLAAQMDELRGSRNSGKTVVLEEGLTVTEVGVPPEEAQYIETRKFQRTVIASEIFRMKPHKIGDLERATFSNIEQESLDYVTDTLMPWLVRIEQEIKAQLLDDGETYAEHLVDGLLRGDAKSRAEALQIMRNEGVINGDEWRELENMNPIEDGSGEVYWMPVNYQPAVTPRPDLGAIPAPPPSPESPPQLIAVKSGAVRCSECNRLLAEVATPPYRLTCSRCKTVAEAA